MRRLRAQVYFGRPLALELLLKKGRVTDPAQIINDVGDVDFSNGKVVTVETFYSDRQQRSYQKYTHGITCHGYALQLVEGVSLLFTDHMDHINKTPPSYTQVI